jgi:hypothetical protein
MCPALSSHSAEESLYGLEMHRSGYTTDTTLKELLLESLHICYCVVSNCTITNKQQELACVRLVLPENCIR